MSQHSPAAMTRNPVYLKPLAELAAEFFETYPAAQARPTALRGYMRDNPRHLQTYKAWAATVLHANVASDPASAWTLLDRMGQVESLRLRKASAARYANSTSIAVAADSCRMLAATIRRLATEKRKLTASERATIRKLSDLVLKLSMAPADQLPTTGALYDAGTHGDPHDRE